MYGRVRFVLFFWEKMSIFYQILNATILMLFIYFITLITVYELLGEMDDKKLICKKEFTSFVFTLLQNSFILINTFMNHFCKD